MLTDDPDTPTVMLTIQGAVENVIDITPKSLVFQGSSGSVMEKVVTLVPTEKYPLNILGLKFNTGKFLTGKFEKTQINGKPAFKVIVTTKKGAKGNFYDKLILRTDNKIKPEILVWVKVRLTDKLLPVPVKN